MSKKQSQLAPLNLSYVVVMAAAGLLISSGCSRSGKEAGTIQQVPQTCPGHCPPLAQQAPMPPPPLMLPPSCSPQTRCGFPPSGIDKTYHGHQPKRPIVRVKPPTTYPPIDVPVQNGTYRGGSGPIHSGERSSRREFAITEYDASHETPDQTFAESEREGPAIVGAASGVRDGQSRDELRWTGAGQDGLRAQLQRFVNSKSGTSHGARDLKFAKTVTDSKFNVDWTTREANLTITLEKNGQSQRLTFAGTLTNKLLLQAGSLSSGARVQVDAACMDLNGGCQTVYAKIQDASSGVVDTAHVLIRSTPASIFTKAVDGLGAAHNREFDKFVGILVNTVKHSGEPGALNNLMLRTTETINGSSTYKIEMGILTEDRTLETLNLGGSLVKPVSGISMAAPASVLRSSSLIADTLRSVALIANDGRGNLKLSITVRKATQQANEDVVQVTISRMHKPVRPLILL